MTSTLTPPQRAAMVRRKLYSDEAAELLSLGAVVCTSPEEAADYLRGLGWVLLTADEAETVREGLGMLAADDSWSQPDDPEQQDGRWWFHPENDEQHEVGPWDVADEALAVLGGARE